MDIILKSVRISNFRSIEAIEVDLGCVNILIGQNNAGKSNFLKALDIAFNGSKTISEEDIYIEDNEHLSKNKKAIIDLKICPFDGKNIEKSFSEFWTGVFTDKWITIDEIAGSYVGIRTIIEFDLKKNDYIVVKKPIVVFVVGLTEGTFPDYRAVSAGAKEMEQEKNNMFVAATRAKRLCYFTYPKIKRMPWGDFKLQKPSRFLVDVPVEAV